MKENIEEDLKIFEEKLKDLKAVYGGAIEAGELSIANIIKNRNRFNRRTKKRNKK